MPEAQYNQNQTTHVDTNVFNKDTAAKTLFTFNNLLSKSNLFSITVILPFDFQTLKSVSHWKSYFWHFWRLSIKASSYNVQKNVTDSWMDNPQTWIARCGNCQDGGTEKENQKQKDVPLKLRLFNFDLNQDSDHHDYSLYFLRLSYGLQENFALKSWCTLREASGCSGPSRLQWKAARSSSGRIWFPAGEKFFQINRFLSEQGHQHKDVDELLTQQSSKAWQVLCLEPELPCSLRQQVLVCCQVLPVPAQFKRVWREIGGHIAECKLRILSDQASESKVPVER